MLFCAISTAWSRKTTEHLSSLEKNFSICYNEIAKEVSPMKCKIIIDQTQEEEVLIIAHARTSLVEEIEELVRDNAAELFGYTETEIVRLRPEEIVCFSVEDGKVFALTDTQKLRIKQRLYVLEELLDERFIKINQSCIANVKKIRKFEASFGGALTVIFKNGHRDYVSRRQMKIVKERIGF